MTSKPDIKLYDFAVDWGTLTAKASNYPEVSINMRLHTVIDCLVQTAWEHGEAKVTITVKKAKAYAP